MITHRVPRVLYSEFLRFMTAFGLTAIAAGTTRWEPVTNGDVDAPEILFAGGDVVMSLVEE